MNFNFNLDDAIDEDFFGSLEGKSSKLQQLFMDDVLSAEEQQQSLKYQRPKASDLKSKDVSEETSANNASSSSTLMAKVVYAFREGESQGKAGLALIEHPEETYALIMYKTKANILTSLKLENNNLFKRLKYWQFYDEQSLYWSFSFDTPQDEKEFVERLKLKNIAYQETQDNNKSPEQLSEEEILDHLEKDTRKPKVHSIPKETNNTLIKRMAKMGRPLPSLSKSDVKQIIPTDYSDSSDTEVIKTPLSLSQKPAISPRSSKFSSIKSSQQQLVASTVALQPSTVTSSAIYPINPLENQYMQLLLTEQRTQGSELRMNMNKLENKIEKVLDKLDLYDNRHDCKLKPEKDDEILELEEKLLILKKENRKLKQILEEKAKENKLNEVLKDLQEDLEEFNINPDSDLKASVKQLVKQFRENIKQRQVIEEKLIEIESINKKLESDLKINELKTEDMEKHLNTLKVNEEILKTNLKKKEEEIAQQKEEILDLQKVLEEEKSKTLNNTSTESIVKSIMNSLYMDIADKLNNSNFNQKEQILSLIANSIRKQTLESLRQISI